MIEMFNKCFGTLTNPAIVHRVTGLTLQVNDLPLLDSRQHASLQPTTKAKGSLYLSALSPFHRVYLRKQILISAEAVLP